MALRSSSRAPNVRPISAQVIVRQVSQKGFVDIVIPKRGFKAFKTKAP